MDTDTFATLNNRMPRGEYWKIYVGILLFNLLVNAIIPQNTKSFEISFSNAALIILSFTFLAFMSTKRCHDREKSGLFALLFFVPLLCIWPTVELLFFRGTVGDNKYGPDPLTKLRSDKNDNDPKTTAIEKDDKPKKRSASQSGVSSQLG